MKKTGFILILALTLMWPAFGFSGGNLGFNLGLSQNQRDIYYVLNGHTNTMSYTNTGIALQATGYFKLAFVYFGFNGGLDAYFAGNVVSNTTIITNPLIINPRIGGSLGILFEVPYVPVNLMAGVEAGYAFGFSRVYMKFNFGLDIIWSKGFGTRFLFELPYDPGLVDTATTGITQRWSTAGFTGYNIQFCFLMFNQ